MRWVTLLLLFTLALVSSLLWQRAASACSCGSDGSSSPRNGETGVPKNAVVRFAWEDAFVGVGSGRVFDEDPSPPAREVADAFQWLGPDGEAVAFDVQVLWAGGNRRAFYYFLKPEAELLPGQHTVSPRDDPNGYKAISFEVANFLLDEPPEVSSVRTDGEVSESGFGNSCGASNYVRLRVEHSGSFMVLDLNGTTQRTDDQVVVNDTSEGDTLLVGKAACSWNWDFDKDGAVTARVAVYDIAGRQSAWSDPVRIDEPSGCYCSLPGTPSHRSPTAALGVLLMLTACTGVRRWVNS